MMRLAGSRGFRFPQHSCRDERRLGTTLMNPSTPSTLPHPDSPECISFCDGPVVKIIGARKQVRTCVGGQKSQVLEL